MTQQHKKIGILLTNTGTPDAATTKAVRRYLREFLSDRRIVQLPRLLWLPILYGFVLTLRPKRSAKLYQKIWGVDDSPMRSIMQQLKNKLTQQLASTPVNGRQYYLRLGMNYGNPSISDALAEFRELKIDKLIVLPLFPQYSNSTAASSFDRVQQSLSLWPSLPEIIFIRDYHDNPDYINALATSVEKTWQHDKANYLLISFHGIPKRFVALGDIYQQHCENTAHLLAKKLNLKPEQWRLCYQSQFGYDKWLQPSTQQLFTTLAKSGIEKLDIICPGFAIDCLETLEEINISGSEIFHQAGGKQLRYIPALNASDMQVGILRSLLTQYC